jgi:hypothetical protein
VTTRERHVNLARGGFADVDDALSWVVRMLDAELKGATMVKVEIEQTEQLTVGSGQSWVIQWGASVSGLITEEDRDPWA